MLNRTFTMLALVLAVVSARPAVAQQNISGEDLEFMKQMEDSMLVVADSMYSGFVPEIRSENCAAFVKLLVQALKTPNSFNYPFTRLQEKINILYPEDKAFRIFNWAIAPTDVTRRYYGAIQMPEEELKLFPLVDYTAELGKGAEDSILTDSKWYGALYYRIIPHSIDGRKIYTLFGLNAASAISNKKVMDPMILTNKGPVFGAPLFNVRSENFPNQRVNRFILEYKKEVQVSMNWDDELNAVYFDKLVSQVNDPNRKYTFVPSGQYDGFKWNGEQWAYIQDLIPLDARKDGEAPAPVPLKQQ